MDGYINVMVTLLLILNTLKLLERGPVYKMVKRLQEIMLHQLLETMIQLFQQLGILLVVSDLFSVGLKDEVQ